MSDQDFFYRRRHKAFLEATRGWPWQLAAFYGLLLDVIYLFEGRLPDDIATVRAWVGADLSRYQWTKFREELIARGKLFVDKEGHLHNPKADELIATRSAERKEKPRKRSEKSGVILTKSEAKKDANVGGQLFNESNDGSSGSAKKKPNADPVPARAHADSLESQLESRGLGPADVILQVEEIAKELGQKRGRYWEPDYRRMIEVDGFTFEDVIEAARAHKAKRGELLRSMNGLRGLARLKRDARLARPISAPVTGETTLEDWKTALVKLAQKGVWDSNHLGDFPGTPDYRGPKDLEVDFLEVWRANGSHPLEELDRNDYWRQYPADDPSPDRRQRWSRIP